MTCFPSNRLPIVACGFLCAITLTASTTLTVAQDTPAATAEPSAIESGADTANDVDTVFATIDGMPITAGDVVVAAEDYARQLGIPPGNVPVPEILNALIDMHVVANAAEAAGFAEDEVVKKRLAYNRARTLHNAYLSDRALNAITDESVRAQYDEEVAGFEPQDELHLLHILVETEDEAKQIISDLEAGGDFAEIAKEKSIDPGSAPNGGDLDFIARGVTVPEFEEAAFALDVGATTGAPVQTQFGWHVIKVEDKRQSSPPELASEEDRIRNELLRDFVVAEIESLRAAADVELVAVDAPADGEAQDDAETKPAESPAQ